MAFMRYITKSKLAIGNKKA